MRQLQHVLFITEPETRLHLCNGAAEAVDAQGKKSHFPLHNLELIVSFAYQPATAELMEACAKRGIALVALDRGGRFRYRVEGPTHGNTGLRMRQYLADSQWAREAARIMIKGKLTNELAVMNRYGRNHPEVKEKINRATGMVDYLAECLDDAETLEDIRSIEANAARWYFGTFDSLVSSAGQEMAFERRSQRPPENRFNSLLSFAYTLLTTLCVSALEAVGLDPSLGVMHSVRPGKPALALDLMEELRPALADRFVLRLINLQIITADDFVQNESGEWRLTRTALKTVLKEWNEMRGKEIYLPALGERTELGLLPFAQAQQLARWLMGDIDCYEAYRMEN